MPGTKTAPKAVQDLTPRLEAVQREVDDAESILAAARERRRQLVWQATEEGMPARAVGRAIGKGTGQVSKILATPGPEEDQ